MQPQRAIRCDPHHLQFSGPVPPSVTDPPVIPGRLSPNGTQILPLHGTQPQSAIPGDLQRSDPARSSVIQPSVIRFPSDGTPRPQLHGTQRQTVIRGNSHLSGHATSSVTHLSVIPGRFSPDATQSSHPPSSQSKSPFMSGHDQSADDKTERRP